MKSDTTIIIKKGRPRIWTKELITDAIMEWYDKYGELPRQKDWTHASNDHPCRATVTDVCGTWNKAIRGAGFTPRSPGRPKSAETLG